MKIFLLFCILVVNLFVFSAELEDDDDDIDDEGQSYVEKLTKTKVNVGA